MNHTHPLYPFWLALRESLQEAVPPELRSQPFFAYTCGDLASKTLEKLGVVEQQLEVRFPGDKEPGIVVLVFRRAVEPA